MQQNIHMLILIVVKLGGLGSPHEKICNFNSSDMPFRAFSGAKLKTLDHKIIPKKFLIFHGQFWYSLNDVVVLMTWL